MKVYSEIPAIQSAYERGFNHGHGIACHNVPKLGEELWTESMGRLTVDAENIREVHGDACHAAADNSRSFSPFEFTAHEFNESEDSDELWEAFEAGTADAIDTDLAGYSDADYGIAPSEPGQVMYLISNTDGRRGQPWDREFATRDEAALAIRESLGWDDIYLSESFATDYEGREGQAWCCYQSVTLRDSDSDGAYAPRIFEPCPNEESRQ